MKIDCPHCGVHGSVDDFLAGKKLRCPECSKVFLVTDDMLPDTDETNLVHQEILDDPVAVAPLTASVTQDAEDALDAASELVADVDQQISENEMFEPMPVRVAQEEDLKLDESEGNDKTEMATCSACGQSFALPFLVEIDSDLYCALCEPETLAFDGDEEDQKSTVEDDDFLAFTGNDDLDETEPALESDSLEVCDGCGESLHPEFLDSFEGKQYCALCLPEDAEDNIELSDYDGSEYEEEIALEASGFDKNDEDYLVPALGLMAEDDEEEQEEEGFPLEACSVCGDKFHKDFLQEIDSQLYCGVCQPEVIETIPPAVVTDHVDREEIVGGNADFTVGDTIKEAWQKTKGVKGAIWGGIFVMYLIIFGISCAGFFGIQGMVQGDPTTALGINGGLQFVTSWLSMLFSGGLMLIGVRRVLEQRVSWKMVFAAFSGKKLLSMSIATALQIVLIGIGFLLLVIPGIYLMVGYALTLPLILNKGLGPWEALETSRKAIHKKWWTVLGMYLVMMLLYMVSVIPLGLGLIWTVPMFMVLTGVLYARLFGYSETEESEEADEVDEDEDVVGELAEESEESL